MSQNVLSAAVMIGALKGNTSAILHAFMSNADILFKLAFQKSSSGIHVSPLSKSLDLDQTRRFIWHDLGLIICIVYRAAGTTRKCPNDKFSM